MRSHLEEELMCLLTLSNWHGREKRNYKNGVDFEAFNRSSGGVLWHRQVVFFLKSMPNSQYDILYLVDLYREDIQGRDMTGSALDTICSPKNV